MEWDKRYRMLDEGEIIREGDEVMTDSYLGWQRAKPSVGTPAPCPFYTAHRIYRRATREDSAITRSARNG